MIWEGKEMPAHFGNRSLEGASCGLGSVRCQMESNVILAANRFDFVFILIQPMKLVGLKKGERPVSTLDSGGGLG